MKKIIAFLFISILFIACENSDKKKTGTEITTEDSLKKAKEDLIKKTADGSTTASVDTANNTTIEWVDSSYLDLGKQKEGKEIEITFRFKNTGSKNLVIQSVTAQCGCTIPEKPEQPFAPGEQGIIKAKYNGSGHGETRKEVYVTANTNPSASHTLTFRAELIK